MIKMIKLFCGGLLLFGVIGISGCNTMSGFGEDMQAGGRTITHSAERHK
jgi:predicted small secreted protein